MARFKVLNKRNLIRQAAFTHAEDLAIDAMAERMMLSRSSFIRWAVLKQLPELLGARGGSQLIARKPVQERIASHVTESVEA